MKNIIKVFLFLTVIISLIYPISTMFIGKIFFNEQVNGSLVIRDGKIIGSKLIAQEFKSPKYFHPRPSSVEYNPMSSGASNYGPISKKFNEELNQRRKDGLEFDMLFTSGSGLDPHISPEAARSQLNRIIKERAFTNEQNDRLIKLIAKHTTQKTWNILGNDLVNVLELNIDLDKGNF